jgi:hypothetical protein
VIQNDGRLLTIRQRPAYGVDVSVNPDGKQEYAFRR